MKGEGMQGEGMMMGKMKDMQGTNGRNAQRDGRDDEGAGDDEERRHERDGRHDG